MTTDATLTPVPTAAADYIREHGWVQHKMGTPGGSVCLHGAIRACTPQPGDAEIVRACARYRGYTEAWNDAPGRTEKDVLDALTHVDTSDETLARMFGPQWEAIVAWIRRSATLTDQEAADLANMTETITDSSWEYWLAAWDAARDTATDADRHYAWVTATNTATDATPRDCVTPSIGPGVALTLRDLIDQDGFTQEDYDILTRAWATVIGPVHPDDKRD